MKKQLHALLVSAMVFASPNADARKIHTIGDSTMANYDESTTVTRGWCQYLQQFFDGLEVNNRGKSGASSKSFYKEPPFWTTVKKQMQPGDYVLIQFGHNDEKNGGMDGSEVKAYYASIGDTIKAESTDYRGTIPSTTYRQYLRKYVEETRQAGCIPLLVGPICRMYFSNDTIRRNGRHDLGDNFSRLTPEGVQLKQKIAVNDNSMDYVYQMQQVASEMDVPFIDLTAGTADLYTSYGNKECHDILGDGNGSTHLSAAGAALIARKFASMCQEQGLLTEYIRLSDNLNITPSDGNLGQAYTGRTLTKEFMVTGFDLTPVAGNVTVTATDGITLSADGNKWEQSLTLPYEGNTLIQRFKVRASVEHQGEFSGKISVNGAGKQVSIPVTATGVSITGGTEASVRWSLDKDNSCVTEGQVKAIGQTHHGMYVKNYSAPGEDAIWPGSHNSTHSAQHNIIIGDTWPDGEIDEVSTRYIEFGVTAMPGTTYNIDAINYCIGGCGDNRMCVKVYYSTEDDFSNPVNILEKKKMPSGTMFDGDVSTVITLEGGKSMRIRFYPWLDRKSDGKTICISDLMIHGYVTKN